MKVNGASDLARMQALQGRAFNTRAALDPFGGANTGVGGVIRDILGVSARPIANTDTSDKLTTYLL